MKSRTWHRLTDIPRHLKRVTATITGDELNVIGRDRLGYSCSLQALPPSDKPITTPLTLPWKRLPNIPLNFTTATTLCGQLVIVGGSQGDWDKALYQLLKEDDEWRKIGVMATARIRPLVVSPSPDRIIIVGGDATEEENDVEECVVVW